MKTCALIVVLVLLSASAHASTILFSWDAIDDSAVTAVKIYGSASASATKPWSPLGTFSMPATQGTIADIADDVKYFYATAIIETEESDPSNIAATEILIYANKKRLLQGPNGIKLRRGIGTTRLAK